MWIGAAARAGLTPAEYLALERSSEIKHEYEGGELVVLQWLKDWLIGHVSGPDRLMSEFLLRAPTPDASAPSVAPAQPQSRTAPAPA